MRSELPLSYQPALADWIGCVASTLRLVAEWEQLANRSVFDPGLDSNATRIGWNVLGLAGAYQRHADAMRLRRGT